MFQGFQERKFYVERANCLMQRIADSNKNVRMNDRASTESKRGLWEVPTIDMI